MRRGERKKEIHVRRSRRLLAGRSKLLLAACLASVVTAVVAVAATVIANAASVTDGVYTGPFQLVANGNRYYAPHKPAAREIWLPNGILTQSMIKSGHSIGMDDNFIARTAQFSMVMPDGNTALGFCIEQGEEDPKDLINPMTFQADQRPASQGGNVFDDFRRVMYFCPGAPGYSANLWPEFPAKYNTNGISKDDIAFFYAHWLLASLRGRDPDSVHGTRFFNDDATGWFNSQFGSAAPYSGVNSPEYKRLQPFFDQVPDSFTVFVSQPNGVQDMAGFYQPHGSLEIQKHTAEVSVAQVQSSNDARSKYSYKGAKYTIFKDYKPDAAGKFPTGRAVPVTQITTEDKGSYGLARASGLVAGWYFVHEDQASPGYEVDKEFGDNVPAPTTGRFQADGSFQGDGVNYGNEKGWYHVEVKGTPHPDTDPPTVKWVYERAQTGKLSMRKGSRYPSTRDGKFKGAVYKVWSNDPSKPAQQHGKDMTLTIKDDGTANVLTGVWPGSYYIHEVTPAPGYGLDTTGGTRWTGPNGENKGKTAGYDDSGWYHVLVTPTSQSDPSHVDMPRNGGKLLDPPTVPGKLTITKVDEQNGGKRLPNATFRLDLLEDVRDPNGALIHAKQNGIRTLKTDGNGWAEASGLPLGSNDPAWKKWSARYRIVETVPPSGYQMLKDPIEVTITGDSNGTKKEIPYSTTIKNSQSPFGKIAVTKLDSDTNRPMRAHFDIYAKQDIRDKEGNLRQAKGKVNGAGIDTDPNTGKGTSGNLPLNYEGDGTWKGRYELHETKVQGYQAHPVIDVTISTPDSTASPTAQATVRNTPERHPSKGAITIDKRDSVTGAKLSNAVFKISAAENVSLPDGTRKYTDGQVIQDGLRTDVNGHAKSQELWLNGDARWTNWSARFKVTETSYPPDHAPVTRETIVTVTGKSSTTAVFNKTQRIDNKPVGKGRIRIVKVDSVHRRPIKGAVFKVVATQEIKDANGKSLMPQGDVPGMTNLTTGDDGTVTSGNLPLDANDLKGHYKVVEVSIPQPFYVKDGKKEWPVTMEWKGGSATTVIEATATVENTPAHGRVKVRKTDKATGKGIKGVRFRIQASRGYTAWDGHAYKKGDVPLSDDGKAAPELVTDADGNAESIDLPLELGTGTGPFQIVETYCPPQYLLDKKAYDAPVTRKDGTASVAYAIVNVADVPAFGRLRIVKRSKVDGNPIQGARFTVKAAQTMYGPDGKPVANEGQVMQSDLATGADGTAETKDLPFGMDGKGYYRVEETHAPSPYVISVGSKNATVSASGATSVSYETVNIEDDVVTVRVTLHKQDKVTKQPIKGATFQVRATQTVMGQGGKPIYQQGTEVEQLVTGDDGVAVSTRPLYLSKDGRAHYEIVEVGVPGGYLLDPTPIPVDGSYKDDRTPTVQVEKTVENVPKTGRIRLQKTDELMKRPVKGAVFQVKAAEPIKNLKKDDLIGTITTDAKGLAEIGNLPLKQDGIASYSVYEVRVPAPYVRKVEPFTVRIDASKSTDAETVAWGYPVDALARMKVSVKKVDATSGKPIQGATFDIKAKSNVKLPDGSIIYQAGATVERGVKSKADGTVDSTAPLWLSADGTAPYELVETSPVVPYAITQEMTDVTGKWVNDTTPVVESDATVKNAPAWGGVEIRKTENVKNGPVKGAKFLIVADEDIVLPTGERKYAKGETVDTIVTDDAGYARTSKHLYMNANGIGHYHVTEADVGAPYVISDADKPVTITYKDAKTEFVGYSDVRYSDAVQHGKVSVEKTENVTGGPVKGATFEVRAAEEIRLPNGKTIYAKDQVVDSIMTKEDGTGESTKPLYLGTGGTAKYYLYETETGGSPYVFPKEGRRYDFTLDYAGNKVPEAKPIPAVKVKNLVAWGSVIIRKTEDVTGGPVGDATFDIVPNEDIVLPNGNRVYEKGTVIETVKTGRDGTARSTKPLYVDADGTARYRVQETGVGQPHYIIKDGAADFEVSYKDQDTEIVGDSETRVTNGVQWGKVSVAKTETATGGPVARAAFDVRAARDIVLPNGNRIYKADQVIDTIVTGDDGKGESTKPLYLGADGKGYYYLYETDAGGTPYVFPEKGRRYDFTLSYNGDRSKTAKAIEPLGVANRVATFKMHIDKTDAEDGAKLDGAVFEIRADDDITLPNGRKPYVRDQLIETVTTKPDGSIENTKPLYIGADGNGRYRAVEIDAPEGHVIDQTPHHFVGRYENQDVPIAATQTVAVGDKPNELDLSKSVIAKDGQTFDDTTVEGATFRLWKKEDELPVPPQEGKDAYALRIDDGNGEHEVALSKPVGHAEIVTADGMDGYAVAVRDSNGNMTKAGTKDTPAKVTTTGEDGLDLDVIISGTDGKALTGLTGDRRVTVHDGDSITIGLDGTTAENGKDNANTNGNANASDDTNKAGDTKATAENANSNANSNANETGNSEADSNANDAAGTAGRSVSVEWGHVEGTHLEPKAVSGAYVFDDLEPGATYNVMVDKKAVYRLDTNAEDSKDTSTNSKEDTKDDNGDQDGKEDQTENAGTDASTGNGSETETDNEAGNGSNDPEAKGGRVFYGRLDTTTTHYAYKRQPMLLTSDDRFIGKFTINGKDYPVETKTNAEGKIIIKRIKTGEYGFAETDVPFVGDKGTDGSDRTYLINTNVFRFTVDATTGRLNDKEVLGTDFTDDWARVDVSKNEITGGPEIPGAHLEIRDSDDKVVEQWTSTDTPHRVDRLTPGKYTLVEVMTPNNYDQATRVEFTVYDTGEVQKVEMHDQPIRINAQIDKRQEIADTVAADTEPNGDGKNRAEVTESSEGKFRYSLDYRNDSTTWVDEFTVYDSLDGVAQGLVRLNGLTTAQAYQDFDGKMNVWFQTNKTPAEYDSDQYKANATKDDGHVNQWFVNPNDDIKGRDTDGDGRVLSYVGWRLWRKDVSVTQATSLSVADLGLAPDEYVTGIRLEYGRVEKGFTTRPDGWDRADLKDAHDDMRPIEQVHEGTFSGSSRDAVLSRLALMRSFVASIADGIETKGTDANKNQIGNGNENGATNNDTSVQTVASEADGNGNGTFLDGNAAANGENGNASAGSPGVVASLADEVSAALDRCEGRVREALDSQDDAAVSAAMHDARNEVVRLIDAAMAKEGTDKDSLASMVNAVDAAYGSVSAGLGEDTAKDVQAGIDEAKRAVTTSDAAAVRKNLGNAISDAIDGLVMDESYGRILKNEAADSGVSDENRGTDDIGNSSSGSVPVSEGNSKSDVSDPNAIHYSATILDMQVTDAYTSGMNMDNSAYVDAYRNGGGDSLEGHDRDKVSQTPRGVETPGEILAQTGDGTTLGLAMTSFATALVIGATIMIRKRSA